MVTARREIDQIQQTPQGLITALYITDPII
jgi:hypothetical protein